MRTTPTLDPDVAAMARRMQRICGGSFKAVINDALRRGLRGMAAPSGQVEAYRTPTVDLGRCLVGSLDDFVLNSGDEVKVVPLTESVRHLNGMVPKPSEAVTLEQMDDAIATAYAHRR